MVQFQTMSNNMNEQLKVAHKEADVEARANRKICVTLLQCNVHKPESSYADVRLFPKKKEDDNFQKIVYVNKELDKSIYVFDLLGSAYDQNVTDNPNRIFLQRTIATFYSLFFFLLEWQWVGKLEVKYIFFWNQNGTWDIINLYLQLRGHLPKNLH